MKRRNTSKPLSAIAAVLVLLSVGAIPGSAKAAETSGLFVDQIQFGDSVSESGHELTSDHSEVVAAGGLSQPSRRLLPLTAGDWQGGVAAFTLKVDPDKQNYLTVKFWGSEATPNRLMLYCQGKQVGYRHLGDIDILDFGAEGDVGGYTGRFYYVTTPLPQALTAGKNTLQFEIRATGRVWGYGGTFDAYQKPMIGPSRGFYDAYMHTDGCFVPPSGEAQGRLPVELPVRATPGPEVLDRLKDRVNKELTGLIDGEKPLSQMQLSFVARAYRVKWSVASENPKAFSRVVESLDHLFQEYRAKPELAQSEPSTPNPGWFGLGPAGDAVFLLAEPLKPILDESIDDGTGTQIKRRAAYAEMLIASRDWHRQHRRLYTNQSMITDMNMVSANRGIAAIDPAHAESADVMARYLYESVGIQPWLGSDDASGHPTAPMGTDYQELTHKGLTRELGFVGYYGEVLDWVTRVYDVTRPEPGAPGDPKIKAQLARIAEARACFRYPMLDDEGNRAMRIETIVGWRDAHYPGDVCYGQRTSWDGSSIQAAAATLDPAAVGYAQQMFDDNQFFANVEHSLSENGLRTTAGLLDIPDQYEILKRQPTSPTRLPMTPGQPDFAFADEDDGVVAIKNGDEIFYASLYWRARYAVNFLARVHAITPSFDRIAVVKEDVKFTPSGQFYTRPDIFNFGFGNGGPKYPVDVHSAMAGEKLPLVKAPPGIALKPGDESPYAGKGAFYFLRYGNYLIGMNCTDDQSFELPVPMGADTSLDLVSRKPIVATDGQTKIPPRTTVVLLVK